MCFSWVFRDPLLYCFIWNWRASRRVLTIWQRLPDVISTELTKGHATYKCVCMCGWVGVCVCVCAQACIFVRKKEERGWGSHIQPGFLRRKCSSNSHLTAALWWFWLSCYLSDVKKTIAFSLAAVLQPQPPTHTHMQETGLTQASYSTKDV